MRMAFRGVKGGLSTALEGTWTLWVTEGPVEPVAQVEAIQIDVNEALVAPPSK